KCSDWKGVESWKVSGLEGGGKCSRNWFFRGGGKVFGLEKTWGGSVRTGRGGKCPDWKGVKVSGLEGGESVRTGRGGSVRTGRGGERCPDWKGGKVSGLERGGKCLDWK
ncbi:unnamed protein product, partial [Staurois parvus]